ncbi:MAG TPA: hypothetical protein VNN09_13410 [Candidatus Competibacteraceae bacterium]|nr:hypothetical protein [Candidatus Competibacteraceae bacterium]
MGGDYKSVAAAERRDMITLRYRRRGSNRLLQKPRRRDIDRKSPGSILPPR